MAKFERARKPEEKEARRQAIFKAARKLLGEVGSAGFSLNELARRSGVSKPNLYRYFESREEVLLQLWVEEVRVLTESLEVSIQSLRKNDVRGVVAGIVEGFVARPQLCELTSVSTALERNLSAEAIVTAKLTLKELTLRTAALLHGRLPTIAREDCVWASGTLATWVAGVWPRAHPDAAVREALSRPELAEMRIDFPRDFTRFLEVLLRGLKAS